MKIRRAFFILVVFALAGVVGPATPGLLSMRALAQASPTAFSCFFAGLNQFNNIINTGILCATPGPGGGGGTTIVQASAPITVTTVTSSPLTYQVGLSIGTCLGISGGSLAYTCPTAGPQATPSPSATGCAFWQASWPYELNSTACAGSGGFTALACTAPIICSPDTGPTPSIAFSPTPEPCPTASTNITITGSSMPNCSFSASGGGGGAVSPCPQQTATQTYACLYTPFPTTIPSSQPGWISPQGVFMAVAPPTPFGGNDQNEVGWPTQEEDNCAIGGPPGYAALGTTQRTIGVVAGIVMSVTCWGSDDEIWLALDDGGNLAVPGNMYPSYNLIAGKSVYATSASGTSCPTSLTPDSNTLFSCDTSGHHQGELDLGAAGTAGTDYCSTNWDISNNEQELVTCNVAVLGQLQANAANPYPTQSPLPTGYEGFAVVAQATSAPTQQPGFVNISNLLVGGSSNKGQITCALSGTACNGTTTVQVGAVCSASYDEAATTVSPLTDLLPLTLKVSSSTLTIYMDTSTSLTGTLAADYVCE